MLAFPLLTAAAAAVAQGYGPAPAPAPTASGPVQAPVKAQPGQAGLAAVPGRTLKDIPNVTITYYDVTGKNGQAIARSIAKNAPRAAGSKESVAGTTNWSMKAEYTQRTVNGKCSIASSKATFSGTATLPRLTTQGVVNRQLQEQWQTYLAGLEAGAVANLGYAYDRTAKVEKAILGATCETVGAVGSAAIAQLKQQAAQNQRAVVSGAAAKPGEAAIRENPVKPESY